MTQAYDDATAKMAPELPVYRCHKLVRAAKVINIHPMSLNGKPDRWLLEGEIEVVTSFDLQSRVGPKDIFTSPIGGYYVRYDDGYESWSPPEAFENGYTRSCGNPMSDAACDFHKAVGIAFMDAWPKDDHHARLRRLARSMCEKEGYDPDRIVTGGGTKFKLLPLIGPNDSIAIQFPLHPTWATYVQKIDEMLKLIEEQAGF